MAEENADKRADLRRAIVEKVLVIWRRLGDLRGTGATFGLDTKTIEEGLLSKAESARLTPDDRWRWWKLSDDILIEFAPDDDEHFPADIIYYLPRLNWVAMWKPRYLSVRGKWDWYVHIGITRFEEQYGSWVFTDLLTDVLVTGDCRVHTILDLDDLADSLDQGLITATQASAILRDTQKLVDRIESGDFPPRELLECHQAMLAGMGPMGPMGRMG